MHRDLKLANILVHFPKEDFSFIKQLSNPIDRELLMQDKLKNMDLVNSQMQIKIADLGFARELSYEDLT